MPWSKILDILYAYHRATQSPLPNPHYPLPNYRKYQNTKISDYPKYQMILMFKFLGHTLGAQAMAMARGHGHGLGPKRMARKVKHQVDILDSRVFWYFDIFGNWVVGLGSGDWVVGVFILSNTLDARWVGG